MPLTRTCRISGREFVITDEDLAFYEKVSPVIGGERILIPPPTLCPEERMRRRLAWRNERKLYRRKCDATGKEIVSLYSPDKPYTVYHPDYWWIDAWDPLDFGREFDPNVSVFGQFSELLGVVPKQSIYGFGNTNSEYTNYLGNSKGCYLTYAGVGNEDLLYCYWVTATNNSLDSQFLVRCREMYNCSDCQDCTGCVSSRDCISCTFCYFCEGLTGKSYYWKNAPSSPEEIAILLKKEGTLSHHFSKKDPKVEDSESSEGERIYRSRNIANSFQIEDSQDCKYASFGLNIRSGYDWNYDSLSEKIYESLTGYKNFSSGFLSYGNEVSDTYYSVDMFSSHHCFLCTGLRNKSYCILNKQYTKEEYEILVPKIIEKMIADGEWGEFFPASLSPFGYNETVANEYYPMTRGEVLRIQNESGSSPLIKGDVTKGQGDLVSGISTSEQNPPNPLSQGGMGQGVPDESFLHGPLFNWSDYESPFPKVEKVIEIEGMKRLPEDIGEIPDDILHWALTCEVSKKPFRIIRQELEFYRKQHLPIPRKHPDVRHMERMNIFQK